MAFPNWIEDLNRWDLTVPPDWFLQGLMNFDPYLVIFPSRAEPAQGEKPHYMLARRRQLTAGFSTAVLLENKHPDTNFMVANGLIPVGPLRFRKGVNTFTRGSLNSLLDDLKAKDQWQYTGGLKNPDAGWQRVEELEAEAETKRKSGLRDMFYHMARDAYRSLKARTGQRNKRASDYHGVARAR